MRRKAQDLLAAKFEFDDELKKSKEKFPDNEDIKSIVEMINENLNIRKDDDFVHQNYFNVEMTRKTLAHVDLVEYLQSIRPKNNIFDTTEDDNSYIPSFSLGFEDGGTRDPQDYVTPQPQVREKSKRLKKVGTFAKSPYLNRVIDIKSKLNNFDFGLCMFLVRNRDDLL